MGPLVVRRIPELNKNAADGQGTLFAPLRFHAFFTTSTLDTITADKTHRGHAIIEQVRADLKNSALAHLPSGKFPANATWLVLATIAFNLTRAASTLTGRILAKATTGTIRRKLIGLPARISSSARHITLHLPPTRKPALGTPMESALHPHLRATNQLDHLTIQPHRRIRKESGTSGRKGPAINPARPQKTASTRSQTRDLNPPVNPG